MARENETFRAGATSVMPPTIRTYGQDYCDGPGEGVAFKPRVMMTDGKLTKTTRTTMDVKYEEITHFPLVPLQMQARASPCSVTLV